MPTREQIAEMAERHIMGGSPTHDREVSRTEVKLYADQARDFIVKRSYWEMKAQTGENDINGQLVKTFDNISVEEDTKKKLFFSEIPANVIDLPNDFGVYFVGLMEDQFNPFVRLPNGFLAMTRGLPSAGLENRMGFWVEKGRIYYFPMSKSDNICEVLIKLVVTGSAIDDDDDFYCPPDIQEEVIRKTVEFYRIQQQLPKDITGDLIK